MTFLVIAFISGVLTVLAPCVLPLLPVVIGTSASGRSKATPYIVVASLGVSIILFTYLLKASTAFIAIPPDFWKYLSGGILLFFGVTLLFPGVWEKLPFVRKASVGSNKLLGAGHQKKSFWGDVIVGASLGPVFSTCSPTYFVILASVLPVSFALGTVYLLSYVLGLSLILLLIAVLGERFASRLAGFSDPKSWLKRALGVLFVVLGIFIILGFDKKFQTFILDAGLFDITKVEQKLLQSAEDEKTTKQANSEDAMPYIEIVNPSGFVNTGGEPITIGQYVGEKVILLDIMTYSCINCQRTFPYVTAWYEKYKDDGLIVIGIHTPEFAFEKDIENVKAAMKEFGINFPVVLDNDYATWNAYGNRYWPRKYLIDINGNIVYDHIGEGAYEETEMKIQELLKERADVLGQKSSVDGELAAENIVTQKTATKSPETYFGSFRNERLGNGTPGAKGKQSFTVPDALLPNAQYFGGTWNLTGEYAEALKDARVLYRYHAKEVYLVAESKTGGTIEVWQNGQRVDAATGDDVRDGVVQVKDSRLYKLIKNEGAEEHVLELRVSPGVRLFAFTFG